MVNAFETRANKLYSTGIHRQQTSLRRATWEHNGHKELHYNNIHCISSGEELRLFLIQFDGFWTVIASTNFDEKSNMCLESLFI